MTLKELRISKGVQPVQAARNMGVSYTALYKIERNGAVSTSTLENYAQGIGATFDEVHAASKATRLIVRPPSPAC